MAPRIDLQNPAGFADLPAENRFRDWVAAALREDGGDLEQTVRVVDADESAELNALYRGREGPTNVLSFPADDALLDYRCLGDLVICAPLVAEDARVVWSVGVPIPGYEGRAEIVDALATGRTLTDVGIDPATFSSEVGRLLVDGNTAVIELSVKARTYADTPYENDYAFFYEFDDDGLLTEMRDYADTINAARQLTACYAESIRELAKTLQPQTGD